MLKHIQSLLERFKTLQPPDSAIRKRAAEVIQQECGFTIPFEKITMNKNAIVVGMGEKERTLVFLHQRNILKTLNTELDPHTPFTLK